jgi:cytochrome c553
MKARPTMTRKSKIRAQRWGLAGFFFVCTAATCVAAGLESAIRNCGWCHGIAAQGIAVAPRLAGQRPQYTLNQLIDFSTHARDNPNSRQYMWGAAANLDPHVARELAAYLASLPAEPANDGRSGLVDRGREIYTSGIPEANIVSCAACHGPHAEGVRDIPRLGGLQYVYLRKRLEQWGEGYHTTAKPPMPRIAAKLSDYDIDALASYLSFVP